MKHGVATKINFDTGVIKNLDLSTFKNVLVIAGTENSLRIFEKRVKPLINTEFHVFTNIPVKLTDHIVYSVYNYASDKKIDCILSVGADAVMECGRLVGLLFSQGGYLHDYIPGGKIGPHGILPSKIYHITVPTMIAAGYEISSCATFFINNEKKVLESQYLIPDATYIDPQLMTGMPANLWAVRAFECFTTALMAFVSTLSNPTSDAYAKQALDSYINHFKGLLEKPDDVELIKHAAAASINSFMAANFSSRGGAHAIADALMARYGFRYGVALAVVCAEVCAFYYDSASKKFDEVAVMLGAKSGNKAAIKTAISKLVKQSGVQVPLLADKLKDSDIEKLALASTNYAVKGSPKEMSAADVAQILRRLP